MPARDHAGGVARGPRPRDGVTVVPDLPAVSDDLRSILSDLATVGAHLAAVVAHVGARMRRLRGQGSSGAEDRDGAEYERLEDGHGASPG